MKYRKRKLIQKFKQNIGIIKVKRNIISMSVDIAVVDKAQKKLNKVFE